MLCKPIHNGEDAIPRVLNVIKVSPKITDIGQEGVVYLEKGVQKSMFHKWIVDTINNIW